MDIISPSAQALPGFLKHNGYRNPGSIQDCPFHPFHNEKMNVMQFLHSSPPVLEDFNCFMTHQRLNGNTWLDVYPLERSIAPDRATFVDVGGALGHMCLALKERYPDLPGRVILQDVPQTIDSVPESQPFEAMAYDYYTDQPVKGAKYYYLRNVLLNLTDQNCCQVLKQTREAMAPDSKILIDETVVPARNAHWRAAQLDMLMMSALGSLVRTQAQWQTLFKTAGLMISNQYEYDDRQGDAVMELVPA